MVDNFLNQPILLPQRLIFKAENFKNAAFRGRSTFYGKILETIMPNDELPILRDGVRLNRGRIFHAMRVGRSTYYGRRLKMTN